MDNDRKKEVINVCLDHFISNGLETSTRSLSKALKLQNAGLYYYFDSKEQAVLLCAEEAAIRLETTLIAAAMKDIRNPDAMMKNLRTRADELSPTMRFFVSVCVSNAYKGQIQPVLDRLTERYGSYAEKFAKKLNCETDEIEPLVYMGISAVANYMIFKEDAVIYPQIEIIKLQLDRLLTA